MSPELNPLLEAYDEKLNCPAQDLPQRVATFERLFADALSRQPGASRDELLLALELRHQNFRRARRKTTTLPPRAWRSWLAPRAGGRRAAFSCGNRIALGGKARQARRRSAGVGMAESKYQFDDSKAAFAEAEEHIRRASESQASVLKLEGLELTYLPEAIFRLPQARRQMG